MNIDVKNLISKGHDLIRIYGVDCNGPANVWNAVKGTNTAMFLGIYNVQPPTTNPSQYTTDNRRSTQQIPKPEASPLNSGTTGHKSTPFQ